MSKRLDECIDAHDVLVDPDLSIYAFPDGRTFYRVEGSRICCVSPDRAFIERMAAQARRLEEAERAEALGMSLDAFYERYY